MTIYKPTYLYIKVHSITGMKYFGKTTKNPIKYDGSGPVIINNIKYNSTIQASKSLLLNQPTVWSRCNSKIDKWRNWKFMD